LKYYNILSVRHRA